MATVFEEIGVVLQRVGQPIAISSSGDEIVLAPGDAIQVGWRIVTDGTSSLTIEVENRGLFDIGRNSVFVLEEGEATTELLTNIAADAASQADPDLLDAELIQALIAAGADPTAIAEATAAGPAAGGANGAGAGVGTIDGAPGVTVNPTTSFSTVNSLSDGTSPDGGTGGTVTNFAVESTFEITSASVLESGLPGGSSPDEEAGTATGSFTITDPNGLTDIDLIQIGPGVFERGDEFLTDLSELIGASVDVGFGIVTLTGFTETDPNTGTFTFSYELDETVDNDSVSGATDTEFEESFDIVVSDGNSLSATGTVSVTIVDDVPNITVTANALDSEDALAVDDDALGTDATADFSNNFTVTSTSSADGDTTETTYTLAVKAAGQDSGLFDTETGNSVYLFVESGVVVGREGTNSTDAANGEQVFTVSVNGSGTVELNQLRVVKQGDTDSDNETVTLTSADLITLTREDTITDGDGDVRSDSATINLGSTMTFADSGPNITVTANALDSEDALAVDDDALGTDATADFSNNFTVTSTSSADGDTTETTYTLAVKAAGQDSGLFDTETGNSVYLFVESGVVVGREGTNSTDAANGEQVFTVSVNGSGTVELNQLRVVKQGDTDSDNETVTLTSADLITLTREDTITDGDGDVRSDSATINLGSTMTFADSGPNITVTANALDSEDALAVDDDALGTDATADFSNNFTVTSTSSADGDTTETTYTLAVKAAGQDSGLFDTETGNSVYLFVESGVVVGREGTNSTDAANGEQVFTVSVNGSGTVELNQLRVVKQGDTDSDNETVTLTSADLITLTREDTITDGDGDVRSDSATINLGSTMTFADSGPNITVTANALDSEDALAVDDDALGTDATADFSNNFTVTSTSSADGDTTETTYTLAVKAAGQDSGLFDTETGNSVYLFVESGVVVGREGTNSTDAANGEQVFTVSVNGSGTVELNQLRVVKQGDTDSDNETVTLTSADLITLTREDTITDGDGDVRSDSATINLGSTMTFADSGPNITVTANALDSEDALAVDDDALGTDATADFSNNFTVTSTSSADGDTTETTYTLAVKAAGQDSGLFDTETGNSVYLFVESGVVVGREGTNSTDAANGEQVFTVSVNGSGTVELNQLRVVKQGDTDSDNETVTLTSADLITLTREDTITDGDGDVRSDSATINLGSTMTFADSGPNITVTANALDSEDALAVDDDALGTDATADFSNNFTVTSTSSADGDTTETTYTLAVKAAGQDSGLFDTETGNSVYLFVESGVVVGREGTNSTDAANGEQVFTVSVNGSGTVELNQLRVVKQGDTDSDNETVTLTSADLITLTREDTITDGDGDVRSDSATINLGSTMTFADSGPNITVTANALDSEDALAVDDDALGTDATADFSNNFTVTSTSSADGDTTETTYTLAVKAAGQDSGLFDTETGNSVYLFVESGVVVGREGTNSTDAANGEQVFTVSVNGSGTVELNQLRVVKQGDTDSDNETVTLTSADLITLTREDTITDGDGDVRSDSATINLGSTMTFADSGPNISEMTANADGAVSTDESTQLNAQVSGTKSVFTGGAVTLGADGGSSEVTLRIDDDASGLSTIDGQAITLVNGADDTSVIGQYNDGSATPATAFTISISATGVVSVTQSVALDHPIDTNPNDALNLADKLSAVVTATDGDGDVASESVSIGASVEFLDDGPSAQVMSPISDERSFSASDVSLNGEQSIGVNGFTISAGTYSGYVPSGDPVDQRPLTNEQSGIGIAGGSNEIDVTEQEYIQIDFGEDVSRASIELGSLGGHYNARATPDAQINVLLFKDGAPVSGIYEFDTDDDSLIISGGKATLELEDTIEFDSVRVFTTQGDPGGVESTNSNFVLLGASINKAFTLSAWDKDGVAELTETSLGYGVKGGSNEVDVTNGEFIQVDFAASVTQVDLELDSLAGNYNVGSNANAEIRVVLFKDGTEVDTLIFDPDEENGALLDISNRKATISIDQPFGFDSLKIYTDDGTDNRTPVNSNFTLKNVEVVEYEVTDPISLTLDESLPPDDGDGVDSITEDFSTFFKAVTDEDYGADGEGSVGYSLSLSGNSLSTGLYALGENGVRGPEIILEQSGNVITGSANDTDYFTLALNPDTGVVTFAQSQNIYHPDSTNPDDAVTLGIADGTLQFIQTVTDGDGDTATASINLLGPNSVATFVIEDDGPSVSTSNVNTLVSESFENLNTDSWYVEQGDGNRQFTGDGGNLWTLSASGSGLEIQTDNVGGSTAYEGENHAELDTHANSGQTHAELSTQVDFGVIGQSTVLTFAYKPRPSDPDSSDMQVVLGDITVDVVGSNGAPMLSSDQLSDSKLTVTEGGNGWSLITVDFGVQTGEQTLTFKGATLPENGPDEQNTLGAYLDSIELTGKENVLDVDPLGSLSDLAGLVDFGTDGAGSIDITEVSQGGPSDPWTAYFSVTDADGDSVEGAVNLAAQNGLSGQYFVTPTNLKSISEAKVALAGGTDSIAAAIQEGSFLINKLELGGEGVTTDERSAGHDVVDNDGDRENIIDFLDDAAASVFITPNSHYNEQIASTDVTAGTGNASGSGIVQLKGALKLPELVGSATGYKFKVYSDDGFEITLGGAGGTTFGYNGTTSPKEYFYDSGSSDKKIEVSTNENQAEELVLTRDSDGFIEFEALWFDHYGEYIFQVSVDYGNGWELIDPTADNSPFEFRSDNTLQAGTDQADRFIVVDNENDPVDILNFDAAVDAIDLSDFNVAINDVDVTDSDSSDGFVEIRVGDDEVARVFGIELGDIEDANNNIDTNIIKIV